MLQFSAFIVHFSLIGLLSLVISSGSVSAEFSNEACTDAVNTVLAELNHVERTNDIYIICKKSNPGTVAFDEVFLQKCFNEINTDDYKSPFDVDKLLYLEEKVNGLKSANCDEQDVVQAETLFTHTLKRVISDSLFSIRITPPPGVTITPVPVPQTCNTIGAKLSLNKAKREDICGGRDFCGTLPDANNEMWVYGCCNNQTQCSGLANHYNSLPDGENILKRSNSDDPYFLAKQLSGSCGGVGGNLKCCDIDELTSFNLTGPPDSFPQENFLSMMMNFVGDRIGLGQYQEEFTKNATMGLSAAMGDMTPCIKGNMVPRIITTDKRSPGFDVLNQYDQENKLYTYREKRDCSQHINEGRCNDLPSIVEKTINKSSVKTCTCVDPEGKSTLDPRENSSYLNFGHDPQMIREQICKGDLNCMECLAPRPDASIKYWQSWRGNNAEGICEDDVQEAENALLELISSRIESSPEEQIYEGERNDSSTNVLGETSDICVGVTNDAERTECVRCIVAAKFWNRGGCTAEALETVQSERLCGNISTANEKLECKQCFFVGGNWTAIGCIHPNIAIFIRQQLFGFMLGIAGTAALGCIMYAGFLLQTSTGDPEKVKKAQELMTSCITGLIIIIFSIFILRIIGVDILRLPGLS